MLKVPEPSTPKKNLFPPRPILPSFNKSSASSYTLPANWQQVALNQSYLTHLNSDNGARLSPVPAVKVEKHCDETLQYPVKTESSVIAVSSIPLLQYPDAYVKVAGTQEHTHNPSPPVRARAESLPPARQRPGSTLGDPLPRKRQKVSITTCVKAESPPPFSLYERGLPKRKYSDMGRWRLY